MIFIWAIVVGGICGLLVWRLLKKAKHIDDTRKLLITILFSILAGLMIGFMY